MRIIVIRHAETEKNFDKRSGSGINLTSKNSDLNHNGIFQAMAMGDYLNSSYHIDAIYTSPALRTLKTAELILQRLETDVDMHVDDRLYNWDISKDRSQLTESLLSLMKKVHDKFGKTSEMKTIVFVTHNHIIDILYNMYVDTEYFLETEKKYKVDNCSIGSIVISDHEHKSDFWAKKLRITYDLIDQP